MALGIMADGVINVSEAEMLARWLAMRPDAGGYAVQTLRERLDAVLQSGDFNCRTGKALFQTLKGLLAGFLPEWMHETPVPGVATVHSGRTVQGLVLTPDIPGLYDKPCYIDLTATFCFTGIFAYGERSDVEAAAVAHGGSTCGHPVKSRPCYVVVGSVASPDWAHGHYGRKVEQAMRFREEGAPVQIISEDTWAAAL
ncbi:BRCT domain-containing protein [uncultured Desulfovibrio sp.]|uniref:BRCT domain-containing protein n=1 Tax=uncultured Desulfovibrio sp. TaxID=167968 RepID=UPI002607DBDA|nr:BRCT domain-containing protein [uncultured Desulfovibrio sp.]